MKKNNRIMALIVMMALTFLSCEQGPSKDSNTQKTTQNGSTERQKIRALYIPLADHYAAIVAYEKYRDQMKFADFEILKMKNWDLLRSQFMGGEAEMAFVMSPLAMDMFNEKKIFRWIGLMHRDGNALAVNQLIKDMIDLPDNRMYRKPTQQIADAFSKSKKILGEPVKCGMPHLLATHTAVLYRFMKEHGKTLGIGQGKDKDLIAIGVPPPQAPAYLKRNNSRGVHAAFEQSLPWADVVETQKFGYVAWYSKDVMPWKHGHVECIVLASNSAIKNKRAAIKEVNYYIHKAGLDIEAARLKGEEAKMKKISDMVRKHIPKHNEEAIIQSLRIDLNVINYKHLNVDKKGLELIMKYAVEGKILKKAVNIDKFADASFSTEITDK